MYKKTVYRKKCSSRLQVNYFRKRNIAYIFHVLWSFFLWISVCRKLFSSLWIKESKLFELALKSRIIENYRLLFESAMIEFLPYHSQLQIWVPIWNMVQTLKSFFFQFNKNINWDESFSSHSVNMPQ